MIDKQQPHVNKFAILSFLLACVGLLVTTDHQTTLKHIQVKLHRFHAVALQQTVSSAAATGSPAVIASTQHITAAAASLAVPASTQHTAAAATAAAAAPLPEVPPSQLNKDSCPHGEAGPPPDELLATFKGQWNTSCGVLTDACMDEGSFVTYGDNPYPPHGPDPAQLQVPWHRFHIGHAFINLAEFGDVAGNIVYPNPIIRPGGWEEETPDLQDPFPNV
jgi:hypothetical protein